MADIHELLKTAVDHHRAGRLSEAEQTYRQVLALHPRHAGAYHLLGLIAFQVGQLDVAANCVRDAMRLDGFRAIYPADLAEIYRAMGKSAEAIQAGQQALKLDPKLPEAHQNLGNLYREQGRFAEATTHLQQARELRPGSAAIERDLVLLAQAQGELKAAQDYFLRAAKNAPHDASAFFHLANCLDEQGKYADAVACYQRAIELQPGNDDARKRLAEARLVRGDFVHGWHDFAHLARSRYGGAHFNLRAWEGQDLQGERIWVRGGYALGDAMQFLRFLDVVKQRGGQPVVDVPKSWIPLFETSGLGEFVPTGEVPADCVTQAYLLGLPSILRSDLASIPSTVPYLSARPDLVATWRDRLSNLSGLRVGLVWQGDPRHPADWRRSMPLAEFTPLAKVPGISLVSLQKLHGLDQLAALANRLPIADFAAECDVANGTLVDTAAIIANLDVVVTVDTSIAHLAGALGAPVCVLLPKAADWRWLSARDDSPWYPTMRLFRQTESGQWAPVVERLAAELARLRPRHTASGSSSP